MAAQALYRKYRPQRFGELVGQEHVTTALRNSVREGRVGHAYLFSGPRGTGKTTTARILAKALNCTNLGSDGEPCGACDNCIAIADGRFLDLFELDAASNNSVDNIRALIETVNLGVAVGARMKVYLIDEVHMLSAGASNALLKTLEEPPGHVVFVLATTNPEKVLPTIRSRTQHFEFGLLTAEQLEAHLADVLTREAVEFERDALELIARRASGSVRDALSLLDQALAHGDGRLEANQTAAALGGLALDQRLAILDATAVEDSAGALVALHELLDAGHDPRRVADDLLAVLRDSFLATAAAGRVRVDATDDELARLRAVAAALGSTALVRAMETLGQAIVDMRSGGAPDAQLVLEVALVRLARREAGPPLAALTDRVERLERELAALRHEGTEPASAPSAEGVKPTIGSLRRQGRDRDRTSTDPTPAPDPEPPVPPAADSPPAPEDGVTLDLDDVILAWSQTLDALPGPVRRGVDAAQPVRAEGNVVTFGIPSARFDTCSARFRQEAVTIRAELTARLGGSPRFSLVAHDTLADTPAPASPPPDVEPEPVDERVDPDELVPAPEGAPAVDSVSRLQQTFGATIVEDHAGEPR